MRNSIRFLSFVIFAITTLLSLSVSSAADNNKIVDNKNSEADLLRAATTSREDFIEDAIFREVNETQGRCQEAFEQCIDENRQNWFDADPPNLDLMVLRSVIDNCVAAKQANAMNTPQRFQCNPSHCAKRAQLEGVIERPRNSGIFHNVTCETEIKPEPTYVLDFWHCHPNTATPKTITFFSTADPITQPYQYDFAAYCVSNNFYLKQFAGIHGNRLATAGGGRGGPTCQILSRDGSRKVEIFSGESSTFPRPGERSDLWCYDNGRSGSKFCITSFAHGPSGQCHIGYVIR